MRLSLSYGKPLQRCTKLLQRFENGVLREISKSHADVIGVMKRLARSPPLFEFLYDLFFSHGLLQFFADICALPAMTSHVPTAYTTSGPTLNHPCSRWRTIAKTKTPIRSQPPATITRGMRNRMAAPISLQASASRMKSGSPVLAKSWADDGENANNDASARITRPIAHCKTSNAECARSLFISSSPR